MLQLRDISKHYQLGEQTIKALDGLSLNFAASGLVAVLGPSGCGKTTLLNIIGGLDRPDRGELIINGSSTRGYTARLMDAYRNHSIGFVFQSYNLISHQSVLSNVELALTLSGVGRAERRRRAKEALESVGLGDQLKKRPSQLSGGQMQRVAIARALVNQPEILLADEPTGALDSVTSGQVMDLLKELSRERLVILVSHNQELAEKYADRMIHLRDGQVESDSQPVLSTDAGKEGAAPQSAGTKKTSMSFSTALSLSRNNLLSKRGRTLITAFAGSIGIIGIALILSLSAGVNRYIINIQKDTMSSYPLVIQEQAFQVESMMGRMRSRHEATPAPVPEGELRVNQEMAETFTGFQENINYNNLTAFRAQLQAENSPFTPYLSDVRYDYNIKMDVYSIDPWGELVPLSSTSRMAERFASFMPMMPSILSELVPASSDGLVSDSVKDSHQLLYGSWPSKGDEVVLILDSDGEINDVMLYQMGILPQQELRELMRGSRQVQNLPGSIKQADLIGKTFHLLAASDYYIKQQDGRFQDVRQDASALRSLVEASPKLVITGIVKPNEDQVFLQSSLGYTRALTDSLMQRAAQSPVVLAQIENQEQDVVTGLRFEPATTREKAENLKAYLQQLSQEDKASLAMDSATFLMQEMQDAFPEQPEGQSAVSSGMLQILQGMMGKEGQGQFPGFDMGGIAAMAGQSEESDGQMVLLLDLFISRAEEDSLARFYDILVAPRLGSHADNLIKLGLINQDKPSTISLYTETFENKEEVARLIQEYNSSAREEDRIVYTDYIALMISSVTTIINVISYVLIAFVAVSLVVSSIMIGIIVYISVLERTKEIGILRAVGASRKDIRRVFTAEAFIIGLTAGIMGIAITLLLILPINSIIHTLTKDNSVNAILPLAGALILVAISALLSLLAGWLPARIAAKKDPVEALRTE